MIRYNFTNVSSEALVKIVQKPNRKGGHRHNHARNTLERKLNKSKASRKRCHKYLKNGLVTKLFKDVV